MKHTYTFLVGLAIIATTMFASCSSSRNAAQTPDDIYYSPSGKRAVAGGSSSNNKDEYYSTAPSDQYVRMRVQDPERWSYFDDYNAYDSYYASTGLGFGSFGYGNAPIYGFGYGLGFGPSFGFGFGDPYLCWNSYFLWNSWYNPYFYNPYYGGGVIAYSHQAAAPGIYSHLRTFNSGGYSNGRPARTVNSSPNSRLYRPGMTSTTAYNSNLNNSNSGFRSVNGNGNYYRPVNGGFQPANNYSRPSYNNTNTSSQPVRSFSPAGGGGGGGMSRPGRH